MSQHYTDPKRARDSFSLPDLEVWDDWITEITCPRCGSFEVPHDHAYATNELHCPSCERPIEVDPEEQDPRRDTGRAGFWYWFCLPGCMPDSSVYGPFETEADAIEDARETAGIEDEDEPEDEDDDPQEPDEDDITTEDHERFYQSGKLVVEGVKGRNDLDVSRFLLNTRKGQRWIDSGDYLVALRAFMEIEQYWPNCWFISDHGNAHLITFKPED